MIVESCFSWISASNLSLERREAGWISRSHYGTTRTSFNQLKQSILHSQTFVLNVSSITVLYSGDIRAVFQGICVPRFHPSLEKSQNIAVFSWDYASSQSKEQAVSKRYYHRLSTNHAESPMRIERTCVTVGKKCTQVTNATTKVV